jgi:hypothetical protein
VAVELLKVAHPTTKVRLLMALLLQEESICYWSLMKTKRKQLYQQQWLLL